MYAAKVLAGSVYDLLTSPDTLEEVQAEFERETGDDPFETALPEGTEPPVDANLQ